jgi:hypothetical protein
MLYTHPTILISVGGLRGIHSASVENNQVYSKQASSSLLLAFASMVILGVEPHQDP